MFIHSANCFLCFLSCRGGVINVLPTNVPKLKILDCYDFRSLRETDRFESVKFYCSFLGMSSKLFFCLQVS